MLYFVADLRLKEKVDVSSSYESANFEAFGKVVERPVYRTGKIMKKIGIGKEHPINEFFVEEEREGKRRIAFGCNRIDYAMPDILDRLENLLKETTGFGYCVDNVREVLSREYAIMVREIKDPLLSADNGDEFFAKDCFSDVCLSKRDDDCLLANSEFKKEIDRITDSQNKKVFLGNFVHYVLKTNDQDNAFTMVNMLVCALHRENRLVSKRIVELKLERFRGNSLDDIFNKATGGTLVIDLEKHIDMKEQLGKVISYINKYAKDVLVIILADRYYRLVDNFCRALKMNLMTIKDGTDSRIDAMAFLKSKMLDNKATRMFYVDADKYLQVQSRYTYENLMDAVNSCFDDLATERYYKSYQGMELKFSDANESKEECYAELDDMIGLEEIKKLMKRIITLAKYNKKREGLVSCKRKKPSLHMCFNGNPGTAKTTMARLLAKILKVEGVLRTGQFVECTRTDLVGKHVGWTAPAVRSKFQQAAGGVLFIDEAYSLVSRDDFGPEAVNAIVQEMENHREDVIVIFAGYPDKMKEFLDMNEGLRSRIPYHLTFADYSVEELLRILLVRAEEQGYKLTEDAQIAAQELFAIAREQSDFGNGRYARNLLEQVILNHVERVMAKDEISEEDMIYLDAQDFGYFDFVSSDESSKCRQIGFAV